MSDLKNSKKNVYKPFLNSQTTNAKILLSSIRKCRRNNAPLFIWGNPGIGKSQIVKDYCKSIDIQMKTAIYNKDHGKLPENKIEAASLLKNIPTQFHFIDLRMAQLERVDLTGIPFPQTINGVTKMDFATPAFLPDPNEGKVHGLIFLDEVNQAPSDVQSALFQLVLDRKVGKYTLPDNFTVLAAGNSKEANHSIYSMSSPLANRFTHVEYAISHTEWLVWAVANKIHPAIIAYIEKNPEKIYNYHAMIEESMAFATPRSWEKVSTFLKDQEDKDADRGLIMGSVGEEFGTDFISFLKVMNELPVIEDIFTGKIKTLKTDKADIKYITCINLLYALSEYDRSFEAKELKEDVYKNYQSNFFEFLKSGLGSDELAIMTLRNMDKTLHIDVQSQAFTDLTLKYVDIFKEIGI